MSLNLFRSTLVLGLSAVVLAGCSEQSLPAAPEASGPLFAYFYPDAVVKEPALGTVVVCNFASDEMATHGLSADYTAVATGGGATTGTLEYPAWTLDYLYCEKIWQATSPSDTALITVSQTAAGDIQVDRMAIYQVPAYALTDIPPTGSVQIVATGTTGQMIKFYNSTAIAPPPPPVVQGGQGCTPGFWKRPKHFAKWTSPLTPSTRFSTAFGSSVFGNMTLAQVLDEGGGKEKALGRHAVAALLNSVSSGVSYDMSEAEVRAEFLAALGDRTRVRDTKDLFEHFNEQGCPLK